MKKKKLLALFAAAFMLLGVQNANASVKLTALSGNNWSHGSENPNALVDEQTNSKWGTNDDNPYIVLKASDAIAPKSYELTTANDTYGNQGRSWKAWKIYGGNFASAADATRDAVGWVLIDSKADQTLDKGTANNQYPVNKLNVSESIPSGTYYTYFKIEIEELEGGWDVYCQMDGFRFTNVKFAPQEVTFTCTAGKNFNTGEGIDKMFDLDCNTKYCNNTGSDCYALVTASEPVYVWGYDMTTANDNNGGRKVTKWSLYGTNDATIATNPDSDGWETLSNMDANGWIEGKNWYTQRFFCNSGAASKAYKYFKVTLDEGGFVQLSEFRFCYDTYRVVTYNWTSGPSDAAKKAFDGKPNPKWEGGNGDFVGKSFTIETADGNSYAVKKYHFTTGDDGSWKDRAPKSWIIEGSNDNSSWTRIAEVNDYYAIHNANFTTYEFTPGNTTDAFRYVRLTINLMKGTGWSQIGDFQVLAVSEVSDKDYYTDLVNNAKSFERGSLSESDPWYVEYKNLCDDADDALATAIGTGNYDAIPPIIDQMNTLVSLMNKMKESTTGYVAFDGTETWGDGHWSQLVDGQAGSQTDPTNDQGTKWGGNFSGSVGDANHVQYVIFRRREALQPYFYKLVTGWDTKTRNGRNWKSWKVYGANFTSLSEAVYDPSKWTVLDNREDISEAYLPMENCYPASFNFTEGVTQPYYYYMVAVTEAHDGDQIQMNEMYLCTQSEFETVLRAPLVANLADFDKTRPYEASKEAKMTDYNTLYAQLLIEDDPVELTLVYNQLVALRTELEESMDYLDFYAAKTVDGVFQLGTADELKTFAAAVNKGRPALNAVLTANIDYSANRGVDAMIGDNGDTRYAGTFNGQGHTVTVNFNNTSAMETGLFRRINGATIQNLKVAGTITTNQKFAGGIVARIEGGTGTITNCESAVTISDNGTGDATHGGILACAENSSFTVANCLFSGSISAANREGCGGVVGWTGGGSPKNITNCLVTGTMTVKSDGVAHDIIARNGATYSGNYYYGTYGEGINLTNATAATAAQITSGALCYTLNGDTDDGTPWTQTIGTDANPIPLSTSQSVHQASPSGYTNLTVVSSKTQIATGADLKKFATEVNAGNTNVDAVLTADIDLDGVDWTPIGNSSYNYEGTFDGAGKAITNFSYTSTGDYNGLFGYINGATIKDFSISGDMTSNHNENGVVGWTNGAAVVSGIHSSLNITATASTHTGGVVGGSQAVNGSTLLVENCSYDGTLTTNTNADSQGGIIGYTYLGTIRNCLFNGTINGNVASKNYGGILGYARIETFGGIHNCLSIGKINASTSTNAAAIIGNWNGPATSNVTNNYYLLADGSTTSIAIGNKADMISEAPVEVNATQLASGEVAYKLGLAFTQVLGTDDIPTLDSSKPNVYQLAVSNAGYDDVTDESYATFVPEVNVAAIPAGVKAFAAQIVNGYVLLTEVEELPANSAVIVRAVADNYYFNNTDEARDLGKPNELGFSETEIDADGHYILAKNNGKVGFYKATSGKIAARKGFLTSNSNVKAFFFTEDDATGIETLSNSPVKGENIYNVAGQKLSKAQKGVNIINGKKILK